MEVQLTRDQKVFIRQAIESGRLRHEEDAVKEAFSLWEERERTRAEILAAVDEAEASLARGEGHIITEESMHELAESVKRRGRARLAAEHLRQLEIRALEERDRTGYSRHPQAHEEVLAWEAEAAWPAE
jgi:Arc/MetJ-type ribon-helix-helix transcriptional regulator